LSTSAKEMLDALGDAIAEAAELTRAGGEDSLPQIWTHAVDEFVAGDPYTLLRIWGGPVRSILPMPRVSIQAATKATADAKAWEQIEKVFAAVCDNAGRPKIEWAIEGYTVKGIIGLRPPGQIGRDDRGRVELVFNFDAAFVPRSA
jgi:hypothetical protein